MSITLNILQEAKNLVNKIKQKDNNEKNNNSANTALISKLKEMENSYALKTKVKMPDYNTILPVKISEAAEPVEIKDEPELSSEAESYVAEKEKALLEKLNTSTSNKLAKLTDKQLTAEDKLNENLEQKAADFMKNQQEAENAITGQGLSNSSIADAWQKELTNKYMDALTALQVEYNTYIAGLNNEAELINTAKAEALAEYDIEMAAEYESKLAKLKNEQLKAIEKMNAYNKKLQEEEDAFNEKRKNQIAELEETWHVQKQKEEQTLYEKELKEGYSGEKLAEMENRYNADINFYNSIDNKTALKLIEGNSSDLKNYLGIYFSRLVNEINK